MINENEPIFNFLEKFEKTQWKLLEKGERSGHQRISNGIDKISVTFGKKWNPSKETNTIKIPHMEIRIRIGANVLSRMNWKIGDCISIYQDPDDIFVFMLMKSANGNGYAITKEGGAKILIPGRITLVWKDKNVPIYPMNITEVKFQVHKQYIGFKIPTDTMAKDYGSQL